MRLHLFFILSLLSITGIAQIPTWTGSLNSDWQTAANWNTSAVPASTDAVIINNSANQPVLDSPRSVASLTINSGAVLNLGSYNLTVSGSFTGNSATVNNGSLVTGSATVTNCTFGAKLTSIGATIQLRNNTYNEKVTVTQTGSSNTTSYGNTFNDPTRLTNSSAGFLSFGVGVADVFNDSLFATVTSTRALYLAHSSAGNQFNGYVEFNKTSAATSTGVLVGSQAHASIFKSVVLLKAAAGAITTQNASFTNCTFDSSATLSVSSGNFTHGQVSFSGCRIYPTVSITTGSTAQVQLTGGTIVYNTFTSVSPSVLLGAVEFKSTCSITKTGSSTDLSSGPIICRSNNLFKNTGTGLYWLGGAASNKFLQGLSVENTGAGTLHFTLTQTTDSIVGTTSITASAGVVVLGSVGTVNKPTLNGNVTLNITGGNVQLNSLKQGTTGSITASAFSGSLTLNDFKQIGTTAINLSGSGAFTVKSGTEIKGDLTVSAGRIYVMGGEFFEEVFLNQTGSLLSQGEGSPIFYKDVEFKCSGTGAFQLNYPNTTFTYHEDLILNNASGGLSLGYIGIHAVKGDVIYKGAYNINSWSNKIVLNGTLNQSIKREHSFTPTILRLEINKPSGTATLETPLIVALDLSLQKGELHTTATNFPTLGSTATITGGSDSSYVVGPISKIGTAAFSFPTGGNGSYAPIGIDAVASSCTFKANYIAEDPDSLYPRSQKDTTLGFVNRCGYWNLDRTSGTQNTKVTLGWSNNPCFAPSPAEAKISRWDGNNWIDFGNINYTGSENAATVKSNSNLSTNFSTLSLGAPCKVSPTYSSNVDSSYVIGQVIKLMPPNQRNYQFSYGNSVLKTGTDSFYIFYNSVLGHIIKAEITEAGGCQHKFLIPSLKTPEISSLCGLESNPRVECQCDGSVINDPQFDFPLNSDNYYKSPMYRRLPTDQNNSNTQDAIPLKRIGVNVIVLQRQAPAQPDNFIDIPAHRNAIRGAFDSDVLRSVKAGYLNQNAAPSDPFLPSNEELTGSGFEFYVKEIYFLPVNNTLYSYNLLTEANRIAIYNYFKLIKGCSAIDGDLFDDDLNYFLAGERPNGTAEALPGDAVGIATFPSCGYNQPFIAFSEKAYSNYQINGYAGFVWAFSRHLIHEFGHFLGMRHTYEGIECQTEDNPLTDLDGYSDLYFQVGSNNLNCPHGAYNPLGFPCQLPPQINPDVTINDPSDPCYNRFTNNIIGGDWKDHLYYTPNQVAKMHKHASITSLRKVVDGSPYSQVPDIIDKNLILDLSMRVYNDIIIRTGITLTLRCSLYMPTQGRIVVEPGARLIMEPNSLISCGDKNGMWQGVRVMGLPNVGQGTLAITQQGIIEMQPGSVIENAEEAVFMGDINNNVFGVSGGIIVADGATFRNNYRSIAFHQYGHLSNQINNSGYFSLSDIKNCHFICDAHLRNPAYYNSDGSRQGSKHFVTLWDIRGVNFTDNTFENSIEYNIVSNCTATNYTWDEDSRGTGIGTFDALFNVLATNPFSGQRNRFINLTRGIESRVTANSLLNNFTCDGSEFVNVKFGIFTEHGNNDVIYDNGFAVLNPNGSGGPETPRSYATFLHNYRYAYVRKNTFNGTLNSESEEWGLVSQQLNSNSSAIISRNDFTKLNRAFQPQRNNTAIQVECNEFWNNEYDWHVNPSTLGNFANQGVGCLPNHYRPGNLFLDQGQNHIFSQQVIGQNGGGAPAWIYFSRSNSPNNETPQFQNNQITGASNSCQGQLNLSDPCPNGTGARMSNDLQAIRLGIESEMDFLESSVTLITDSLDHQQTDSLLALINDTTIGTINIHAALYNHSPLSDTVMISFLERDTITSAQFISLFSFNLPGSTRLMDSIYAYSLTHPMDTTTWDSLQKLQAYNPNMESITQIQRSIRFYRADWKRVVAQTERALIEENKLDDLITFYKDSLGAGYEEETFGAYLAAGNVQSARNWLQNNFPQNTTSDSAFFNYHTIYLDLQEDSITWLQLNGAQLNQIKHWASTSSEIQHLALAVLALRGDTVLNELPEFSNPPSAKFAHTNLFTQNGFVHTQNGISVFPNPSNGLFTLELENELENIRVGVYDVTGRNVFENQWRNKSKAQTISLQHLSNGVYYLQVRSGNQFIGVKPIVIQP